MSGRYAAHGGIGNRSDIDSVVMLHRTVHLAKMKNSGGHWRVHLACEPQRQVAGWRAQRLTRGAIGFVNCEACRARAESPTVIVART